MNGNSNFIFNNNESEVPWEIQEVDKELNKQLLKDFKGERSGFIRVIFFTAALGILGISLIRYIL